MQRTALAASLLTLFFAFSCTGDQGGSSPLPSGTGGASSGGASSGGASSGCPSGLSTCGSACVDLSTNATNCGVCGRACVTGQSCSAGVCQCQAGLAQCGASCVDTRADAANCGQCGTACPSGQVCSAGQCGTTCASGTTNCSGSCVDLSNSALHCGTCGTTCPTGQLCTGSRCGCGSGQTLCGAQCVNTASDGANCGACGKSCSAGATCTGGVCIGGSTGGAGGGSASGGAATTGGGAGNGGAGNGGAGNGGAGGVVGNGGAGGAITGGVGGSATGGTANGGSAGGGKGGSGGASTGGAANGGKGGSGGTSTGGASTGGASTGGTSTGGTSTGGTSTGGTSTGGTPGTCDPGTTTTAWATSCPTSAPACTAGTWVAGGPDPDHSGFTLILESAHFAIYSDETISTATAQAALDTLENTVWKTLFGAPIYFKEPLCNLTTKNKVSIHVHSDWGLTGGAWTSTRMGMWIGTGALNDHWGLTHEFTHALQSVSGGLACNQSNTCGWIYESHANWVSHQLPEYRGEVHCSEMSVNAPHLYLGSTRDRYCNWQFMEFLKDKHCYSAVNEIWTSTPSSNDPFSAIMKTRGWNISQLNDFFGEWAMHNVTWDYKDPPPTAGASQSATYRQKYASITDNRSRPERRQRRTMLEPLDTSYASNRRFVTPTGWAPQRWGYNIVRLYPEAGATSVNVTFRGVTQGGADSDFRWGLVATDSAVTTPRYSGLQKGADGQLNFCVKSGEALFLVVVATPSVQKQIVWDQMYNTVYRYPWMVALSGAWPEGFQGGAQDACVQGTRHSNGGGCVVGTVPASAYVGPYAAVVGGTVSGTARIEDHAVVTAGTVSGGTVTGLSVLMNGFSVSGSAKVATTFYPLGFFEGGQAASGTANVIGDVEYRGQGLNKSSGTYYGFVEAATASSSGSDVTVAPPYAWRP